MRRAHLLSLWGSPGGVIFALGVETVASGDVRSVLLRSVGDGRWTVEILPDTAVDIWGSDENNLYLVGGDGRVLHRRDGGPWVVEPTR
jgi:hypothetical protein